jgi:hypothetical protein
MFIDMVEFGSPAEASGIDFDWQIDSIIVATERPMKEWVFIPALFLTLLLIWNQKRRMKSSK